MMRRPLEVRFTGQVAQNRVDLKVKLGGGEIVVIEVQASSEPVFLQRLLYSTSKVITEHMYRGDDYYEVTPEYYLIKANSFDDAARNTLDEWIYVLKNGELPDGYSAKGLEEAKILRRASRGRCSIS